MKTRFFWAMLATMLVMFGAGCSNGGSGGGGNSNPNVAAYPTAVDVFEGSGGDNTIATAATTALGTSRSHTIYPVGDIDYFKVNLVGGKPYEFSANHLSINSDTEMTLYAADGTTQIAYNDDSAINYDSTINYTPTADETVYVKVDHLDIPFGVLRYTFSAHEFVDSDADSYSTFYDCNDNDASIAPWEVDIPGDGIDQDCSGADVIAADDADAFEVDNEPAQAKILAAADHFVGEVIFMGDIERANMRTIYPTDDIDWFKVSVPAYSAVEFDFGKWVYGDWGWMNDGLTFEATFEIYPAEILTNTAAAPITTPFYQNSTNAAVTIYLKYSAIDPLLDPTGVYIPVVSSYGTDKDGDLAYTRDWSDNYDCNDNDPDIYAGAFEVLGDSIDQNCDGVAD